MTDYTQTGEQAAILNIFGYAPTGEVDLESPYGPNRKRFLDIGAWNPKAFSMTRALFELGWGSSEFRSVMFEPSPGPLRDLVKEYGLSDRVTVVGSAVTVQPGLVELLITDDAVSCHPDSEGAKIWSKDGGFFGKMLAPGFTVQDIFNQFGAFDFVSIDTEGTSVNLFAEMLRVGFRPGGFCVEHNDRFVELASYAQDFGYAQVLLNGCNAVFEWKHRVRKGE